jgi:hypothetical protein
MAKRDIIKYFLEQQNVYFELVENVKDLDAAFKAGYINDDAYEKAKRDISVAKENYDRLAYIVLLLNKPNTKAGRKKEEEDNKEWYDALKGASREALLDESKDALADFKLLVKEAKENTTNGTK